MMEATPGDSVSFADLKLAPQLLDAVRDAGYTHPTPIQQQAIPLALSGRDLIGLAQTGTGKPRVSRFQSSTTSSPHRFQPTARSQHTVCGYWF